MDRSTFVALAIAIVILIVLVFTLGGDGESAKLAARIAAESINLADAEARFETDRKIILDALEAEPVLFQAKSFDKLWPQRLKEVATELEEAQALLSSAEEKLKNLDKEGPGQIDKMLALAQSRRVSAAADVAEMGQTFDVGVVVTHVNLGAERSHVVECLALFQIAARDPPSLPQEEFSEREHANASDADEVHRVPRCERA